MMTCLVEIFSSDALLIGTDEKKRATSRWHYGQQPITMGKHRMRNEQRLIFRFKLGGMLGNRKSCFLEKPHISAWPLWLTLKTHFSSLFFALLTKVENKDEQSSVICLQVLQEE